MCSPLNKLGRSHERQTQEIITTLSPFLARLVPSSVPTVVQVAFQIPKLCWDSEAGVSLGYRSYKENGEINITFGNSLICVSEYLCVGDLCMSVCPHEHIWRSEVNTGYCLL